MNKPARSATATRFDAASLLAVAVGGFLGAAARIGLAVAFPDAPRFPAGTLLVNVLGSAGLGICSTWWSARPGTAAWVRAGIGTGFFGAFTTFSTVVVFALGAPWAIAVPYAALSVLLSALAAWAGMLLVERLISGPRAGFRRGTGPDRNGR